MGNIYLTRTFLEAGGHAVGDGLGVVVSVEVLVSSPAREDKSVPVAGACHQPQPDRCQYLSRQLPL